MTNSPEPLNAQPSSPEIRLPRVALAFYCVSPFMLLIGGFLSQINARYTFDWAIFQTMLGTVIFWAGAAALIVAIILSGVRSIAQQQLGIQLQHDRDRAGLREQ